ncbi:hypothetical protein BaRGS_00029264 [Batillaria attramentaria]|uniref:Protein with SprT-like domain at the N terminus n=1 Tax=Batillaria attramentaria TaxID=370345 RepID=A0ABD0JWY0_9CAEN
MDDPDLILAQRLQEEFDRESANAISLESQDYVPDERKTASSSRPLSVVDPSWEVTDPNPDVRTLFLQFNDHFFWGKLSGVEVKWSPRMTLCAGVCSYEGRGGLCSIRLSVPLLKLRPRKDLVETLLHEMIHAFLFVTENDRDRDGHGPNFQKHMHRINKASGAKITIYHDFHDEVDSYRQHWWRCDGPCRNRKPYFGFVKRAMNRAPSPKDFWWGEHQRTCGGTYTKVKEPEGYGAKKKGGKEEKDSDAADGKASGSMDIRSFLGKGNILGGSSQQSKIQDKTGSIRKTSSTSTTSSVDSSGTKGLSNNGSTKNVNTGKNQIAVKNTSIDALFRTIGSNGLDPKKQSKPVKPTSLSSDVIDLDDEETVNNVSKKAGPDTDTSKQPGKPMFKDGKTWTAVETGSGSLSDMESKNERNRDTSLEGGGRTLGNGPVGLNWLSAARKQWAKESTPTSVDQRPASCSGKIRSSSVSEDDCGKVSPIAENSRKLASSSEESCMHGSFHVSSCEEDKWPTPESYYKKKASHPAHSGKRTAVDLLGSDDEDEASLLPASAKRLKFSPSKSFSSPQKSDGVESADESCMNVFERVKMKNKWGSPPKGITCSTLKKGNMKYDSGFSDQLSNQCRTDLTSMNGVVPAARGTSQLPVPSTSGLSATGRFSPDLDVAPVPRDASDAGAACVSCPVCQVTVAADRINQHLDLCLM